MINRVKRGLASVLAVVMMVTMLPMEAFADTSNSDSHKFELYSSNNTVDAEIYLDSANRNGYEETKDKDIGSGWYKLGSFSIAEDEIHEFNSSSIENYFPADESLYSFLDKATYYNSSLNAEFLKENVKEYRVKSASRLNENKWHVDVKLYPVNSYNFSIDKFNNKLEAHGSSANIYDTKNNNSGKTNEKWTVDDSTIIRIDSTDQANCVRAYGLKAGETTIRHSYIYNGTKYIGSIKIKVSDTNLVPVAVYASDGVNTVFRNNVDLKTKLGIGYVQSDDYAPIGVIYLPSSFFNKPGVDDRFIRTENDWNEVKNAISNIDTSKLVGDGTKNAGNNVAANLDKVKYASNQGAGSQHTALFKWNGKEYADAIDTSNGNYKYHLDLEFNTNVVHFYGIYYENGQKKTVELTKQPVGYLVNAFLERPDVAMFDNLPEGYTVGEDFYDHEPTPYNTPLSFKEGEGHTYHISGGDNLIYTYLTKRNDSKITLDLDGGNIDGNSDDVVVDKITYGDTINDTDDKDKVKKPEKEGYDFDGWVKKDDPNSTPVSTEDLKKTPVKGEEEYVAHWTKKNDLSYTIKCYLNKTEDSIRTAETVGNQTFNETAIVNAPVIGGYTAVKTTDSVKISGTSENNVVKFYYYKNVTATADSDEFTYDGTEKSVTGFTVSDTTADNFDTVSASAKGTDAAEYTVNFNKTENVISDDEKYIITSFVSGKLTINKCPITVSLKMGDDNTKVYDGKPHDASVSVSGLPEGFSGKGESNTTVTNVADGTKTAKCDSLEIKNGNKVVSNDNFAITYEEAQISIVPFGITVYTPSAEKVYDGKALTASKGAKVSELKNGETVELKVTGTQTKVASSKNTYELVWGNTDSRNYKVSEDLGTLVVKQNKSDIVVTVTGGDYTYDGKSHTATVDVSTLPEGYTLETAEVKDKSVTNVSDGSKTIGKDDLTIVIKNAEGEDVTSDLNIKVTPATIKVVPATLTVVTPTAEKTYDGTALTAEGNISGFVNGETATFTTTGTQTAVGSSDNTYSLVFDQTAKASNYKVEATVGKLTVKEFAGEITVTTTGGTFGYDGTAHGATVSVANLPAGYTVKEGTQTANKTVTDVARDENGKVVATAVDCDSLVILNAAGDDVTSKLNVKKVPGTIKVTPVTLTVSTPTASKTYDGEALTAAGSVTGFVGNETATFATTGTQTAVGDSNNTYTLEFNKTAKATNYEINSTVGKLTVSEYAGEITVTTTGFSGTYDGKEHAATVAVSELPKGYSVVTATSNAKATHVVDSPVEAKCDTLVIENAQGVNVTDKLDITYVDSSVVITPAKLTVTTNSDSKKYDGKVLTADGTVEGFVNDETATFKTTGSQKSVGHSTNFYSLIFDGTATKSDYEISETLGTLTVTQYDGAITVTVTGGDITYDGQEHKPVITVTGLPEGYTATATTDNKVKNVSDGTVKTTAEDVTVVIKDENGKDVTAEVKEHIAVVTDGSALKVNPATLTITTGSSSKAKYDGTAVTSDVATVAGAVDGETITVVATGSQTNVGSSTNTYEITYGAGASKDNYTEVPTLGTLSVDAKRSVVITGNSNTWDYDGNEHTDNGYEITGDGFVSGEGAAVTVTGAVTIGKATNVVSYVLNDGTSADNYAIEVVNGQLTIKDLAENAKFEIQLSGNSADAVYDGKEHTVSGFKNETNKGVEVTYNGKTYYVTGLVAEKVEATDVSNVSGTITGTPVVKDAAGNDVTAEFKVTTTPATLNITPKTIYVTTESKTREYNGNALTAAGKVEGIESRDGYTFTVTGSQTRVGSTPNTYSLEWNSSASAKNYTVSENLGTLNVTSRDAKYAITITGNSATYKYDGTAKTLTGITTVAATESENAVVRFFGKLFGTNNEVSAVSTDENGKITITLDGNTYNVSGITSTITKTNAGTYTVAPTGTAVITDADGVDVSNQFAVSTTNGQLVINKRHVTITSASDSKAYDGTALKGESVTYGGDDFVSGEGVTITYNATEGITLEGEIANEFTYTFNEGTDVNNYDIETKFGTLTIGENIRNIVVNFVDVNGNSLATAHEGTFAIGHEYTVAVPTVAGYTPAYNTVVFTAEESMKLLELEEAGTRQESDPVVITVVYTRNYVPSNDDNGGNTPEGFEDTSIRRGDNDILVNPPSYDDDDNGGNGPAVAANNNNVVIADDATPRDGAITVNDDGTTEIVDIEDEDVARAGSDDAWALINLIAMIFTVILAIFLLVLVFKKKDEDEEDEEAAKAATEEDEKEEKNHKLLKLSGLIPAIISVVAFILTENMRNPMELVDQWTILMIILLVVEILIAYFSKKEKNDKDEDNEQVVAEV